MAISFSSYLPLFNLRLAVQNGDERTIQYEFNSNPIFKDPKYISDKMAILTKLMTIAMEKRSDMLSFLSSQPTFQQIAETAFYPTFKAEVLRLCPTAKALMGLLDAIYLLAGLQNRGEIRRPIDQLLTRHPNR